MTEEFYKKLLIIVSILDCDNIDELKSIITENNIILELEDDLEIDKNNILCELLDNTSRHELSFLLKENPDKKWSYLIEQISPYFRRLKRENLLGKELEDVVSGFKGIATGRAEYLTGCIQYLIQPKCEDDYRDSQWFDECRLFLIGDGVKISNSKIIASKAIIKEKIVYSTRTGSDKNAPKYK